MVEAEVLVGIVLGGIPSEEDVAVLPAVLEPSPATLDVPEIVLEGIPAVEDVPVLLAVLESPLGILDVPEIVLGGIPAGEVGVVPLALEPKLPPVALEVLGIVPGVDAVSEVTCVLISGTP